jgi:hypothetical protein
MEKYGTARQATDYSKLRRKCFTCWIIKDTDTHSEYIIIIVFHGNNGYENAPQCDAYSCIVSLLPFIPQPCGGQPKTQFFFKENKLIKSASGSTTGFSCLCQQRETHLSR